MDRRHLVRITAATAMAWCLTAGVATAQSLASATMAVSIEITPNCTVATAPLAFRSATAAAAPSHAATASIEVACGPDVAFTVQLDDGQNAHAGSRRALDPATGQYVGYEIYADAAHTRRWGSLEPQSVASVTALDGKERLTAYGLIGNDTEVAAGRYGDLVTVTTNF